MLKKGSGSKSKTRQINYVRNKYFSNFIGNLETNQSQEFGHGSGNGFG